MKIEDGCTVSIEYTLKDDDGNEIDSNVGGEKFEYVQGGQQIVEGLEKALAGLKAGDSKEVKIPPAEGYGEIEEKAIIEVPLEHIPEEMRTEGTHVQMVNEQEEEMIALIKEVKEEVIVLDFNHPLAGETLHFSVLIKKVSK